ncbi:MAG: hypothetical protein GF355_09710, partial [Candidatus Eisenbacteria bacterium]|nr:hypothetical protein [Candidatus Eisenbacteria bacterium]
MGSILVFLEQRNGALKKSSLEVLARARQIGEEKGREVSALVVGSGAQDLAGKLGPWGAQKVHVLDDASFDLYTPQALARLVARVMDETDAELTLMASSALGRDLAPRVAAAKDLPLLTEALEVHWTGEDRLQIRKSMYGGKIFGTLASNSGPPFMATVKPGAHPVSEEPHAGAAAETVELSAAGETDGVGAKGVELIQAEGETVDLQEA